MTANPADAVKQRAVRFDMPHNQLARGKNKITERRTHLTFMGSGVGVFERDRVSGKTQQTGPANYKEGIWIK